MNDKVNQGTAAIICKSEYITMRDGVRLAMSAWIKASDLKGVVPRPVILTTTRYWRTSLFKDNQPDSQKFYPAAVYYYSQGYIYVAVDARGTGASFGSRDTEISPTEVADIGEIIDWLSQQPWCDGRVVAEGVAYTASTALYSMVTAAPALKAVVCRAPDFDGYRHLGAPGGIVNYWFLGAWGGSTEAMDNNDAKALLSEGYTPIPKGGVDNLLGVSPVDEDPDGTVLALAVADHKTNFNAKTLRETFHCLDNPFYEKHRVFFDTEYQHKIEQSGIPIVIRCGWHDGGTALGALAMFASFDAPIHVILDPWNHTGNSKADPFNGDDGSTAEERPLESVWASTFEHVKKIEQQSGNPSPNRIIDYYTLGENVWKSTAQWPLPNTRMQRWFLSADNALATQPPVSEQGSDEYVVDASASAGTDYRWHGQARLKPILFPDRGVQDNKLLIYDSQPLTSDTEITGHPVVHLWLRSSATDGQFFAYLETIDPDGRVRLLTDGQLRGLHRKLSSEKPPYTLFGPYHSLLSTDAQPMVPGEVTEIAFDLFPISVLLKKGQRIRLAIAGADKDTFAAIPGCEAPTLNLERNAVHASYIDLPMIKQTDDPL